MSPTHNEYKCASNQSLPTLGVISVLTSPKKAVESKPIKFVVTRLQRVQVHLIGRESCRSLGICLDELLYNKVSNEQSVPGHQARWCPTTLLQTALWWISGPFHPKSLERIPVLLIKKPSKSGHTSIRVSGDYSVTINPQLEMHRHPMPQPEDLMRRLGRGHSFTKIGLADAYNQICLGPESQKKLALSTHMGVLLQKRLPFGITSAPG